MHTFLGGAKTLGKITIWRTEKETEETEEDCDV